MGGDLAHRNCDVIVVAIVNYGCELKWSGIIPEEVGFELEPDGGLDCG